jgi:hypothetical protein
MPATVRRVHIRRDRTVSRQGQIVEIVVLDYGVIDSGPTRSSWNRFVGYIERTPPDS